MPTFQELLKKAHGLHKTLGEKKFRELYEKSPATLIDDLGARLGRGYKSVMGANVLQAFPFYGLPQSRQEIHGRILESYQKQPVYPTSVSKTDAYIIHILEARGLLRTKRVKAGRVERIIVTHVLDRGVWKEAAQPK